MGLLDRPVLFPNSPGIGLLARGRSWLDANPDRRDKLAALFQGLAMGSTPSESMSYAAQMMGEARGNARERRQQEEANRSIMGLLGGGGYNPTGPFPTMADVQRVRPGLTTGTPDPFTAGAPPPPGMLNSPAPSIPAPLPHYPSTPPAGPSVPFFMASDNPRTDMELEAERARETGVMGPSTVGESWSMANLRPTPAVPGADPSTPNPPSGGAFVNGSGVPYRGAPTPTPSPPTAAPTATATSTGLRLNLGSDTMEGITPQANAMIDATRVAAQQMGITLEVVGANDPDGGSHASHQRGTEVDVVGYHADGSRWTVAERLALAEAARSAGGNRFGLYSGGAYPVGSLHMGVGAPGMPQNVAWGPNQQTSGVPITAFAPEEQAFVSALRGGGAPPPVTAVNAMAGGGTTQRPPVTLAGGTAPTMPGVSVGGPPVDQSPPAYARGAGGSGGYSQRATDIMRIMMMPGAQAQMPILQMLLQQEIAQSAPPEDRPPMVVGENSQLWDPDTREWIRPPSAPSSGGYYGGTALDAQALNNMIRSGRITPEQADDLAAGKTILDPATGAQYFYSPQALLGTGAPGGSTPVPGPAGTALTGGRPPTAEQARDGTFATRMESAGALLGELEQEGTSLWQSIVGNVPFAGNYMRTPEYQRYDQARRDFINAQLRRESGAVISPEEFANANQQYFPQPGDSPEVIAQKNRARQIAIENMKVSAGPAYRASTPLPEPMAAPVSAPTPPPAPTNTTVIPRTPAAPITSIPGGPAPATAEGIQRGFTAVGGPPAAMTPPPASPAVPPPSPANPRPLASAPPEVRTRLLQMVPQLTALGKTPEQIIEALAAYGYIVTPQELGL